jgi:DNA replication protein DnaC
MEMETENTLVAANNRLLQKREALRQTAPHIRLITTSGPDSIGEIAKRCMEKSKFITTPFQEKRVKQKSILSGVPLRYKECRFENFQGGQKIIETIKPLSNSQESAVLTGSTGSGKTHLAVALMAEYLTDDPAAPMFITVPELLLKIRSCFSEKATTTEEEIVEQYSSCEFLVLDDLGAEKESEFVITTLYLIINRRNNYGRKTIITTNLSLQEIETKLGARIASRLSEM